MFFFNYSLKIKHNVDQNAREIRNDIRL